MNMGKFSEKLVELLELAKKKKNVLEYQEINDFFKDQNLEVDQMEKVFDFLEASGVDVLRITGNDEELIPVSYTHLAQQPVRLRFQSRQSFDRIVIGPHTLFAEYPPKNPEAEIKPVNETGEIVLSKVVIPEYVIVHNGPVGDQSAGNYYVRYKDYIKNVASSEIYATWPDDTIRANVLAIMSVSYTHLADCFAYRTGNCFCE